MKPGPGNLQTLFIAAAFTLAIAAPAMADDAIEFSIDAGDLKAVLTSYIAQSGNQLLYRVDEVSGICTDGLKGAYDANRALEMLLAGTGFQVQRDESGAVLLVRTGSDAGDQNESDPSAPQDNASKSKDNDSNSNGPSDSASDADASTPEPRSENRSARPHREMEVIVVTGTRIQRLVNELSAPVTVVDGDVVRERGFTNVGDALAELPITTRNTTNASTSGSFRNSGTTVINLRGLSSASGSSRTLTLVNGRRHVAGQPGTTNVNVATIPSALVERVEIVSGGSSAIYGSDAVAGVINYVLKNDYDGLDVSVQYGATTKGDGERSSLAAAWGKDFDRGNFVIAAQYTKDEEISFGERSHLWQLPTLAVDGSALPNATSSTINNGGLLFQPFATPFGVFNVPFIDILGTITGTPFAHVAYGANQSPFAFNRGTPNGLGGFSDGDGIPLGINAQSPDLISAPVESYNINVSGQVLLSDDLGFLGKTSAFVEAKYSGIESSGLRGFFTTMPDIARIPLTVGADNPYLDPSIALTMQLLGATELRIGRQFPELGPAVGTNESDSYRIVAGFKGETANELAWDFYVNYGKSERISQLNDLDGARFAQAVDAIDNAGTVECRDPSNGCVPVNILGANRVFSSGFMNFVSIPWAIEDDIDQTIVGATLSGDAFGIAGSSAQFAAGLDYREESTSAVPNAVAAVGGGLLNPFPIDGIDGDFDVLEVFGELKIPLVSDTGGRTVLVADVSGRYGEYSTVGGITNWKAGLMWAPVQDFRLRGSFGTAIRAPNLAETARVEITTPLGIFDQCSPLNWPTADPNRAINCAEIAATARAAYDQGLIPPFVVYFPAELLGLPADGFTTALGATSTVGNNPSLQEEEADTFNIGFALEPRFIEGLRLSVDYWNIDIDGAIVLLDGQAATVACYDGPPSMFPAAECDLISRDATLGLIRSVLQAYVNVDQLEVAGYDYSINYDFEIDGAGEFSIGWIGTRFEKFDRTASNSAVSDQVGIEGGVPEFSHNLHLRYLRGPFSAFVQRRQADDITGAFRPGQPVLRGQTVWDASLTWVFSDKIRATLGGSNIFDDKPDVQFTDLLGNSSQYDLIGPRWFLQLNASF